MSRTIRSLVRKLLGRNSPESIGSSKLIPACGKRTHAVQPSAVRLPVRNVTRESSGGGASQANSTPLADRLTTLTGMWTPSHSITAASSTFARADRRSSPRSKSSAPDISALADDSRQVLINCTVTEVECTFEFVTWVIGPEMRGTCVAAWHRFFLSFLLGLAVLGCSEWFGIAISEARSGRRHPCPSTPARVGL